MAGFKGNFALKMDSAGRVALPMIFRKSLPEAVTLLKGMSKALYVIPEDKFDEWVDGCGFMKGEPSNLANEEIYDRLYGESFDATIDSAGRISIPAEFREAAHLGKDVTCVGLRDRIELWDSDEWRQHRESIPTLGQIVRSLDEN